MCSRQHPPWPLPSSTLASSARVCACLRCALAVGLLAVLLTGPLSQAAHAEPTWTTYHRDAQRSGNDPDATDPIEPVLAWQTVDLGAPMWNQPLVLGNRIYAATVGDKVYALEAATGMVMWEKSVGTPVPASKLPCGDIEPTVGVVGTPVIDSDTGTIYVVADRWDVTTEEAKHWLVGLSLASGEEVLSTNVDPPGADPKALLQRTALNLDAGQVVFGMGGNDGDCGAYKGTVVAVPENGGPPSFWQYRPEPPSSSGGAVWATGGPAVDGAGNVYATTGNPNPVGGEATIYDYSDSVLKLNPAQDFVANPGTELAAPLGAFEPPTWKEESNSDKDLGSAAPELLPGGVLFQAGKSGTGYLIDETTMSSVFSAPVCHEKGGFSGSFGGDSFAAEGAGGVIYAPCENGTQALSYDQSAKTFTPLWQAEQQDAVGPPIVSAGLVWTIATGGFKGGGTTMYGFDPATGQPRYFVTLPSPVIDHFASPSAAGGRLFVASGTSVSAYRVTRLAAGESAAPTGGGTNGKSSPTSPKPGESSPELVPVVLRGNHLHANSAGVVRVALRCTAPAKSCRGTISLRARPPATRGKDRHRVPQAVTIALARKNFGPAGGSFVVRLRLGRRALALLRRHKGRLGVMVEISAPGHRARRFTAVLTLPAQ
jgi:polyvinyl alcohol dehydrogenase (cytochrome)